MPARKKNVSMLWYQRLRTWTISSQTETSYSRWELWSELRKSKQFIKGTLIKKKRKFSSYTRTYKEIQMGSAAKSYMRKSFMIYEEMHKYLTICGETVSYILLCNWSLLNSFIYEEKLIFFLISAGANWSRVRKVISHRYRKLTITLLDIIWPQ